MFISKKAQTIREYTAGEQINWGYIKLNSNENAYPPSKAVLKAIKDETRLNYYPNPKAEGLKKALGKLYGINPDNIFIGNGSDEVLGLAYIAFFDPKDKDIVFADITYSFYPVWAELYDINYREIPVGDDFAINADDYLNLNNCQGIIIANPNAPTSLEMAYKDILKIVKANQDKVIIIDEAYADFGTYNCLDLAKEYNNVLIVRTFSKAWALAGLRCGFAFGDINLIKGLEKIRDCFNSYSIDRLAQAGAMAAVNDYEHAKKTTNKIINTRQRVILSLKEKGYNVLDSKTNFIFFKPNLPAKTVAQRLKERKILVRHFDNPKTKDYLRVSIGADEQMDKFLDALAKVDK